MHILHKTTLKAVDCNRFATPFYHVSCPESYPYRIDKSLHQQYNVNAIINEKRLVNMAATIQVRVDEQLKISADTLFSSLGLDTSTAIRMFLVASTETNGIPFAVKHDVDRDSPISEAIQYRKSGGEFLTAEQSLANMRLAIKEGAERGV